MIEGKDKRGGHMQYIFDLDGTLRVTGSGKPVPNESYDQNILPSVRKRFYLKY